MEIKGIGTDIIDVKRISKIIKEDNGFVAKVFSEKEITYSDSKHSRELHFAARFAAKEAFFKAMGTGWRDGMKWTDISVSNNALGKPEIFLTGKTKHIFSQKGFKRIHLSISHTREYAVSFVTIEGWLSTLDN